MSAPPLCLNCREKTKEMLLVDWNGIQAHVKPKDLEDAISAFREMGGDRASAAFRSVERALNKAYKKLSKGKKFSAKQKQDIANDICLWLAYKKIQGLDGKYKQVIQ